MPKHKFVYSWPMYLVVEQTQFGTIVPTVLMEGTNIRGIPVFTEELDAERYRDSWKARAIIGRIADEDQLKRNVASFRDSTEATHVAFDACNGKRGDWIVFGDILD